MTAATNTTAVAQKNTEPSKARRFFGRAFNIITQPFVDLADNVQEIAKGNFENPFAASLSTPSSSIRITGMGGALMGKAMANATGASPTFVKKIDEVLAMGDSTNLDPVALDARVKGQTKTKVTAGTAPLMQEMFPPVVTGQDEKTGKDILTPVETIEQEGSVSTSDLTNSLAFTAVMEAMRAPVVVAAPVAEQLSSSTSPAEASTGETVVAQAKAAEEVVTAEVTSVAKTTSDALSGDALVQASQRVAETLDTGNNAG